MLADTGILSFIDSHVHIIGWSFLCTAIGFCTKYAWSVRGAFDKFMSDQAASNKNIAETLAKVDEAKTAALDAAFAAKREGEQKAAEILAIVNKLDTNHLAHMEKDLAALNSMQEKHLEILTSIDKGIAILCDRARQG